MNVLLLDTHALLWYLLQPVLLSAGTVWEVATKHRKGKLPEAGSLVAYGLVAALTAQAITVLPITGPDAEQAGINPAAHGDPFDRMIAAQAVLRGVSVVSSDPQIGALGAARVW